ncbi:MAG: hypothetical protein ACR2RB_13785 [Gammaproteobacteria bacterium]
MTDIQEELDRLYPAAYARQIVEYEGQKYIKRFWPRDKSRSGKTVYDWGSRWEPISDEEADKYTANQIGSDDYVVTYESSKANRNRR